MSLTVIRAGKAVTLLWALTQEVPRPPVAYDPATAPTVTIFDPSGTAQVTAQATVKVGTGLYAYIYVTPSGGPLGTWTAWLDTVDAAGNPSGSVDAPDQAKATPAFQLV